MVLLILAMACDRTSAARGGTAATPDSLPTYAGDSLPFQYPPGLYMQQIQDDVVLRLYVDEFGRPVPESTHVETASKYDLFDSAAVKGARDLVFHPAIRAGKAIPYPVLFPIKFRVPGAPPMPGDVPSESR